MELPSSNPLFDHPIPNFPYNCPQQHWELDTDAGKTTVMAMLIAWQTINAVRRPTSKNFTLGFLICAPGLTIKDRLRVLQPNDPNGYYKNREMLPSDMLVDMGRAKIVIINYHAFKMRERIELSKGGRQLLQGSPCDDADLQEVYDTERHLLYVACTRARDQLLVTGIEPTSEFLDDFRLAPRTL